MKEAYRAPCDDWNGKRLIILKRSPNQNEIYKYELDKERRHYEYNHYSSEARKRKIPNAPMKKLFEVAPTLGEDL